MKFKYKDIDTKGAEILDSMASAPEFNKWTYETIGPYCKGNILEIGSGVGNISQFFLKDAKPLELSDIRGNYRQVLKERFDLDQNILHDIDIAAENFEGKYPELLGKYDTVFALNVVEHIQNDRLAVVNMLQLLKSGGKMLVLVPAYQTLYCDIDLALEHFRRYNKKSIEELMAPYGQILRVFYFNFAGILAWWFSGKILRQKTIPEGEMKIYNFLVPVFKLIDKVTGNKAGLSVICVLQKK